MVNHMDTLKALIQAGVELHNNYTEHARAMWRKALADYQANPPLTMAQAGAKGGSAKSKAQTEARRALMQKINEKRAVRPTEKHLD